MNKFHLLDSAQIPNGWELRRLKHVGTVLSGTGFPHDYQGNEDGELPFLKVSDLSSPGSEKWVSYAANTVDKETARQLGASVVPENSVVYAKIGAALLLNKRRLLSKPSCIDNNMSAFVPKAVLPEWALWWMTTLDFSEYVNPGAIPSFTEGQQKELPFLVPPLETQRRIADYLDRETARIDALVAEKEKMLALLEEKRTALISSKVTRGLDPDAPLKPSGLDWLGDIPAHWEVRRCTTIFREIDERGEPDLPLLNVSLNTGVTRRLFSEDKIESVAADFSNYKIARRGMLVFNKMRFWQGAAGIAPIDGLTSPDYTVAEIIDAVLPKYIEYVVRLPQFNNEVRRYSYGMVDDRLRLYWDSFKNIRLPMPPIDEQNRILDYLDKELSGIGEVSESIKTSLSLIKERRAALITAAVTGQLDLKEMAA